jgi:hypothetical protein
MGEAMQAGRVFVDGVDYRCYGGLAIVRFRLYIHPHLRTIHVEIM